MANLNKNFLEGEFKHFFDAQPIIYAKIFAIIEANKFKISNYEIMAYANTQIRLIIRYFDCFDIYDFKLDHETKKICYTTFYTADFTDEQSYENMNDFSKRYKQYIPEEDEPTK